MFLADVDDKRLPTYGISADSRRVAIELAGPTARTNVVTFGYLPTGRNPWAAVADPRTGRPLVLEFPRELFLHYVVQYLGATK